ncbi:MAG: membrane protein insertase YidC, partial [Quisquiliibacterium sp.]
MQRTILWVVFSMSLLFLWDSWQRYNGKPPLFGAQPTATQEGAPAAQQAASAAVPSKADASIPSAPTTSAAAPLVPSTTTDGKPAAATPKAPALKLRGDVLALDI